MQNLIKRLEKKGWKRQEIIRAVSLIQEAKRNKTEESLFLGKRIYWVLLAIIVTANFAIAVSIIPLLLALKGFGLYFIIAAIGFVFGVLFEVVIRSIEHLETGHHIALAAIIPVTAIISGFLITGFSNEMSSAFRIKNFHEPFAVALAYAASFSLPYIACRFVMKRGYYSE